MGENNEPPRPVLADSDYRPVGPNGAAFRVAWGFKGDAIPRILEMLKGAAHPWIHACCGGAVIPGEDVRIDLFHPSGQSIDVAEIDRHYEGAGAIIMDPPYGEKAWGLGMRQRVVSACMRALAPGGRLILHAPWQPIFTKRQARRTAVMVRDDSRRDFPMPPVILACYQKTTDPRYSFRAAEKHRKERERRGKA